MALCAEGKGCYSNQYKDFAFDNLETILGKTDVSQNAFEAWWAKEVATEFKLEESDIANCYSDKDSYNTDGNTRALWKYGTAKGVNGTPTVFLNGVKLDSAPMTVEDWMTLLNDTRSSQYGVSQVEKYLQN